MPQNALLAGDGIGPVPVNISNRTQQHHMQGVRAVKPHIGSGAGKGGGVATRCPSLTHIYAGPSVGRTRA